jgi:hypothetical protein
MPWLPGVDEMLKGKEPTVLKEVLSSDQILRIKDSVHNYKKLEFEEWFSRYTLDNYANKNLDDVLNDLLPLARKTFNSKTLLPTYALFSHYEGKNARLHKHIDDNACTYTIDLCLYQKTPWGLWVENKEFLLEENEALAYYGNDQLHWRQQFPDKENNQVAMIFFHFAEPDHWYFTKGPSYLQVIRKEITEEQWAFQNM